MLRIPLAINIKWIDVFIKDGMPMKNVAQIISQSTTGELLLSHMNGIRNMTKFWINCEVKSRSKRLALSAYIRYNG